MKCGICLRSPHKLSLKRWFSDLPWPFRRERATVRLFHRDVEASQNYCAKILRTSGDWLWTTIWTMQFDDCHVCWANLTWWHLQRGTGALFFSPNSSVSGLPVALGSFPAWELFLFTMSLAPPVFPSPIFLTDTYKLWLNFEDLVQFQQGHAQGQFHHLRSAVFSTVQSYLFVSPIWARTLEVGLGIFRTNTDSQWNQPQFTTQFHQIFGCGNETTCQ